jgi:hypothetical protein
MSRDSAVGIATGYGLNGRKTLIQVPVGPRWCLVTFPCRHREGGTQAEMERETEMQRQREADAYIERHI